MDWNEGNWNGELLGALRALLHLRRKHKALSRGDDQLVALGADLIARLRRHGDEWAVVVVNRGAADAIVPPGVFDGSAFGLPAQRQWTSSDGMPVENGLILEGVALPAMSAAIYLSGGAVA
jgi:glycosidase